MLPGVKIRSLIELQELLDSNDHQDVIEEMKKHPSETLRRIIKETDESDFKDWDNITDFGQLSEQLQKNGRLIDVMKTDPIGFVQRLATKHPLPEYNIYRILVSCLCGIVIIIVSGLIYAWITKNSREAPTLMTAVACTCLGLLAGIFVSVPGKGMAASKASSK